MLQSSALPFLTLTGSPRLLSALHHISCRCGLLPLTVLGARFTMDADLDYEIKLRMSMARQAFEELKRTRFLNKNIPLKGRLQLYNSLVVSRLMYGSAVWADVPRTLMLQLDSVVIDHQRRMAGIGFWNGAEMTDVEFRHHLEVSPFRVAWACNRLKYLQHIAQHAAPFHKEGLLLELANSKGWLWETAADIAWMSTLVELPCEIDPPNIKWQAIWEALSTCRNWKAMVSRAERKHVLQERIARDVHHYHDLIVQELTHFGLDIWKGDDLADHDAFHFACVQCDRTFRTRQARAAHAYRKHNIMSDERPYIPLTNCPGCLRDFHTTWRLQQHLKYHPNGCWDRVHGARVPDTPVTIALPEHLKHIKRLPAVRRLHGPLRPTSMQRQRISLNQRICALRSERAQEFAWWHPESDPVLVQLAIEAFNDCLRRWCSQVAPDEISFHNMFCSLP